ncbi:hypothetical protein JNK13_06980 [bacterium]|nr:hypothetical protein [bacterium]
MTKNCLLTNTNFTISDRDLSLYDSLGLNPPTLCPEERLRRRIGHRNFRSLYHRQCSKTQKALISMYHPQSPRVVVDNAWWWSDAWDAKDYARDLDLSQSFFDQYRALAEVVPHYGLLNVKCENSDYSNFAFESKNCYLVFGCVRNEDCLYGHIVWDSRDCIDCLYAYRSELSAHSVDIVNCYKVFYSLEAINCQNCYFLFDCQNCKHCFGGVNLRNAEYCFFGEQCTADEYFKRLDKIFPLTDGAVRQGMEWLVQAAMPQASYPEFFGSQVENVSGNHLYEAKDLENCFDAKKSECASHCFTVWGVENSADISFTGSPTRYCVDALTLFNAERVYYSQVINNCYDVYYSEHCYGSHDLFGCNGLRNAAYCILNQQYTKEKYFEVKAKLIAAMHQRGEWGEFFPLKDAPFAYNESIANEYLPLSQAEAEKRGLHWKNETTSEVRFSKPHLNFENISAVENQILEQQFSCADSGKAYRIIPQELAFYRQEGLPLSKLCPDRRHELRMCLRTMRKLSLGQCKKCNSNINSAHLLLPQAQTLCMECYQAQVWKQQTEKTEAQ